MTNLRLATDDEGDRLKELCIENGFQFDHIEFNRVFPSWLVAVKDNQIVGCCQILLAYPIAQLEHLAVDQSLTTLERARIFKQLEVQSQELLRADGVAYVSLTVSDDMMKLVRHYEKNDAHVVAHGSVLLKRLV